MKRGNWTDGSCFYVSIKDGKRFALVAGPFQDHQEALDMVQIARQKGEELDTMSIFYAWGTVKMSNGYREGLLNQKLGI